MENVNDTRETRLVFDYKIGRALLKRGHYVVDIKPSRDDRSKCILIFKNSDVFQKDFNEIISELKEKSSDKNEKPIEIAD